MIGVETVEVNEGKEEFPEEKRRIVKRERTE